MLLFMIVFSLFLCLIYKLNFITGMYVEEKSSIYRIWYFSLPNDKIANRWGRAMKRVKRTVFMDFNVCAVTPSLMLKTAPRGFTFCSRRLKILDNFKQRALHFHFALGPPYRYVAGPD